MNFSVLLLFCLMVSSASSSFLFGNEYVDMCRIIPDDLPCECDMLHQKLDCMRKNMTVLYDSMSVPDSIRKMDFRENKIRFVSTVHFDAVTSVEVLDLSSNEINEVKQNSFLMFSNLKSLSLARNNITVLNLKLFGGLERLEELDLSYNKIKYLQDQNFLTMFSLKTFYVHYNPLGDIFNNKTDLFNFMPQIQLVNLEKTGVSNFHQDIFKGTTDLKGLVIARNPIKEVPKEALKHLSYTLEFLDLSDTELPMVCNNSFPKMSALRTLYMSNIRHFERVESYTFSEFVSLETLMMQYNPELSYISGRAFHTLEGKKLPLKQLHLRRNNLENLHLITADWDDLQVLDLQDNPWVCDCKMHWAKTHLEPKILKEMKCDSPASLKKHTLLAADDNKFTCGLQKAVLDVILVMSCLLAIVLLSVSYSVYRYRVTEDTNKKYNRVRQTADKVELEWDETDLGYMA